MTVHIGTSGWNYDDWRGTFYPKGLAQRDWLTEHARHFATVEINASFYRLPAREQFVAWRDATPNDYRFAVKASQYLTHMKRLRDPGEPVERFLDAARGLGDKLGPVLMQLPPNFHADPPRLDAALAEFPTDVHVAVEVRHDSWFVEETREVLARHDTALCLADRDARWLTPRWRTADWTFMRFHWGNPSSAPCYAAATLDARLRGLTQTWSSDEDAFVYFNNDPGGCAVRDAALFGRACDRHDVPRTRVPERGAVTVATTG